MANYHQRKRSRELLKKQHKRERARQNNKNIHIKKGASVFISFVSKRAGKVLSVKNNLCQVYVDGKIQSVLKYYLLPRKIKLWNIHKFYEGQVVKCIFGVLTGIGKVLAFDGEVCKVQFDPLRPPINIHRNYLYQVF